MAQWLSGRELLHFLFAREVVQVRILAKEDLELIRFLNFFFILCSVSIKIATNFFAFLDDLGNR